MIGIDLHTHSTYSDGRLTPDALCALASKRHIHLLALCDHDTTDGIVPMQQAVDAMRVMGRPLELIPGVELSTGAEGRTHILGYGANVSSKPLQDAITTIRDLRKARIHRTVEALEALGIQIPPALIPKPEQDGMAVGRPHLARVLIQLGVVNNIDQAFDRYLGEGKPAYVPLDHLSAMEAVALLRSAGIVAVLAHPARLKLAPNLLEALIASLQDAGLQGLEVYHPSASRSDVRMLAAMARRRGLLVTGGSDFHGDRGTRAKLGGLPAGWHTAAADVEALQKAMAVYL